MSLVPLIPGLVLTCTKRLAGASLLVFANKTDVDGCMDEQEILSVRRPS
jgi:hypothetical protein